MKGKLCCMPGVVFFLLFSEVFAQNSIADHVVISEVQIAGATARDEFVELYNPTSASVDLSGWRLTAKTASGGTTKNLVTTFGSVSIPPRGFVLIAPDEYDGAVARDVAYSTGNSISSNNTIILYSDNGITIVDMLGLGTAVQRETATAENPSAHGSVERKASAFSDAVTLSAGGSEEFAGNGQDTDNNSADFVRQILSNPQNSSSQPESDKPIPVELLSFQANYEAIGVRLKWRTASETENFGFHIFRAVGKGAFEQITSEIIPGAGNSAVEQSYEFLDARIEPGMKYAYRLADVDFNGNVTLHEPVLVETGPAIPQGFRLQSYPNPLVISQTAQTKILFELPRSGHVRLGIYSIDGRLVRMLVNEEKNAGQHQIAWTGRDEYGRLVSAGIYLYKIELPYVVVRQKMIVVH